MDTISSEIRKALDESGITPAPGNTLDEIAGFLARIASYDKYINIDFNDFISIIRASSTIGIASETVPYDNIGETLSSILSTAIDGRKPDSVIVSLNIGPDFMIGHMSLVSEAVGSLSPDVDVVWGLSNSNRPEHEAEVAVVLGFK